jgi:predicted ArsR family transcriptional regulator
MDDKYDISQLEAKALSDKTRRRVLSYIAQSGTPVTVAEITGIMGLNHNAVRQHLAVLKKAGLVTEEFERRDRPGRPRLLYRPTPQVNTAMAATGPYVWLSLLLAKAVTEGVSSLEVGREEGIKRGRDLLGKGNTCDLITQEMTVRGFCPTKIVDGQCVDLQLNRCPFADVVGSEGKTICQLHLGIVEGMVQVLGGTKVVGLMVADDPHQGRCHLVLEASS